MGFCVRIMRGPGKCSDHRHPSLSLLNQWLRVIHLFIFFSICCKKWSTKTVMAARNECHVLSRSRCGELDGRDVGSVGRAAGGGTVLGRITVSSSSSRHSPSWPSRHWATPLLRRIPLLPSRPTTYPPSTRFSTFPSRIPEQQEQCVALRISLRTCWLPITPKFTLFLCCNISIECPSQHLTLLSRYIESILGPTRKSSPWGNFSDGGLNQSIKRRLSL